MRHCAIHPLSLTSSPLLLHFTFYLWVFFINLFFFSLLALFLLLPHPCFIFAFALQHSFTLSPTSSAYIPPSLADSTHYFCISLSQQLSNYILRNLKGMDALCRFEVSATCTDGARAKCFKMSGIFIYFIFLCQFNKKKSKKKHSIWWSSCGHISCKSFSFVLKNIYLTVVVDSAGWQLYLMNLVLCSLRLIVSLPNKLSASVLPIIFLQWPLHCDWLPTTFGFIRTFGPKNSRDRFQHARETCG